MSRKFIVAIAAVAALGMSTLIATDAFARGGGGGGGHFGGGHFSSGHASGFNRTSLHGRTTSRTVNRNVTRNATRNTTRTSHVNRNRHAGRPNTKHPHRTHVARHHHGHHWWWWCRHHSYRCGGTWIEVGVDGGVVPVDVVAGGPQAVAATTPAAVCTNECDYFLKDEPGCYMAKRAFSTPAGDELRCVKICEEPQHAAND